MTAALTVENVSKTFPGQRVLDAVSLDVRPGEVHALLGENGSGKSTLIKILAGVHLPDEGATVLVRDVRLPFGSPAASFALGLRFVHQKHAVVTEMNAVENIALETGFTRPAWIDWGAQAEETRRLLARIGIEMDIWAPLRDCKPLERHAVAIARALRSTDASGADLTGADVPLLVLDEPTASLPAAEVEQLFAVINQLTARGVAVIYVSHRLDEVFRIADRVSVLRDGVLRATAPLTSLSREEIVGLIVGRATAAFERKPRPERERTPETTLEVDGIVAEQIDGVSLSVAQGEIVGVAGVAGSGREMLARAIAGAILPTAGTVRVAGRRLESITPKAALRAGVVLALGNTQPHSALADFTVAENLTLAALARHSPTGRMFKRRERAEVDDWMGRLDIRPRDPRRPYRLLSGGNQQKVIIGKWLNARPKTLIVDEPTAGVDVGARQAMYSLIAESAARGLSVLLCSSDLEDIVQLADRALVMRSGRIVAEFAGDELAEDRLMLACIGSADSDVGREAT